MKITVELPRSSEAEKVSVAEESIEIEPVFLKDTGYQPFLYLTLTGGSGQEKKYIAQVRGVDGNVQIVERKPVTVGFDTQTPEEAEQSRKDRTPAHNTRGASEADE